MAKRKRPTKDLPSKWWHGLPQIADPIKEKSMSDIGHKLDPESLAYMVSRGDGMTFRERQKAAELIRSTVSEMRDRKDAERYRFLKSRRGNVVAISWNSFHRDIYATAQMGNVDAAIDKAMEETGYELREAQAGCARGPRRDSASGRG